MTALFLTGLVVGHFEDELHVMGGTSTPYSPVEVIARRSGNEKVVHSRFELHASRCGGEGPECDGEVHELVGPIALGNDPGVRICDMAIVVLFPAHIVDYVSFYVSLPHPFMIPGANNVGLIVLCWKVALSIDIDNVVGIVDAKYGVRCVPVDVVHFLAANCSDE